jgi:hypothetical protein
MTIMRKVAMLLLIAAGSAAGVPASAREEGHAMGLDGFFQADRPSFVAGEPISVTLVLHNDARRDLYVFVPRERAEGVEITVVEGLVEIKDMRHEPESGLIGETRIRPGETYRQPFMLSDWLNVRQPGAVRVVCRILLAAYPSSLRDAATPRLAESVEIATVIGFAVLPGPGPARAPAPGEQ